jgi:uncharacterized damage-inducible protein DinB
VSRPDDAAQSATQPSPTARAVDLPGGNPDERELLLGWLGFFRAAILRKLDGLSEDQARWRPDGRLISLLGIVNHLTHVEARWIDAAMRGEPFSRDEAEFAPGPELSAPAAAEAYRARAVTTDTFVRAAPSLNEPCTWGANRDLRWVLLHLINETARHAGHADATRELLDGSTGV